MLDGVTGAAGVVESNSAAEKARSQLSGDFETFLLLLTTQLQNQDPVEPLDTHEFTAQLVQFANVEQAIATNTNLETMIEQQQGTQINNVANYIGKFVQATGNASRLQEGVATFSYSLPAGVETAEISIMDSRGLPVYTGTAPSNSGKNDVLWDGTNSFTGQDMEPGMYSFAITAKDSAGTVLDAETYTTGFVSAVTLDNGEPRLEIGDIEMTLDKVLAVRDPLDFAS